MKIVENLTQNYSRKTRKIKYVIIHYTGMQSEIESIKRLKDPKSKVSAHYLINVSGKVIQLVKDNDVAWHAGKSRWKNDKNLNTLSLGIELQNKGHKQKYPSFPKKQINSLVLLLSKLKKKYKLSKKNILGHSDIAPLRKFDPGKKFPWKILEKKELANKLIIKNKLKIKTKNKQKIRKIFFTNLYKIGYRYFKISSRSKTDKKIVMAFQSRFLQKNIDGKIDLKTLKISHFLAN